MTETGHWVLSIDSKDKALFLKSIRAALNLTLPEAASIEFPKAFTGTHTETKWLAFHALANHIHAIPKQR